MMTKLFKDPCSIINTDFYRYGDENLKKVSDLKMGSLSFKGFLRDFSIPNKKEFSIVKRRNVHSFD